MSTDAVAASTLVSTSLSWLPTAVEPPTKVNSVLGAAQPWPRCPGSARTWRGSPRSRPDPTADGPVAGDGQPAGAAVDPAAKGVAVRGQPEVGPHRREVRRLGRHRRRGDGGCPGAMPSPAARRRVPRSPAGCRRHRGRRGRPRWPAAPWSASRQSSRTAGGVRPAGRRVGRPQRRGERDHDSAHHDRGRVMTRLRSRVRGGARPASWPVRVRLRGKGFATTATSASGSGATGSGSVALGPGRGLGLTASG